MAPTGDGCTRGEVPRGGEAGAGDRLASSPRPALRCLPCQAGKHSRAFSARAESDAGGAAVCLDIWCPLVGAACGED